MTAPLTIEEIEALEALEKTATPREWSERTTSGSVEQVSAYICNYDGDRYLGAVADVYGTANAALIAALRNAAPALLAMARENRMLHEINEGLADSERRYLAALKTEAIARPGTRSLWRDETIDVEVGGITFRVTRDEAGELQAEEVTT